MSKRALFTLLAVTVVLGAGGFAYFVLNKQAPVEPAPPAPVPKTEVIGRSVEGRNITAYTFGTGPRHLLFVGGMHGGYEWNSVLLAYNFLDYFTANPSLVPAALTVTIIPSLNPDGVYAVVGKEGRFIPADATTSAAVAASGRFNANKVDLNRNFDCKWQPTSTWRSEVVSAGSAPFSEPETQALRSFIQTYLPAAVVFWHSQANAVYASECEAGILPQTLAAMNAYATAGSYPAVDSFDAYPVTGDAEGWLASVGIPAITVELSTHDTVEWEKNLAGVNALLTLFARP